MSRAWSAAVLSLAAMALSCVVPMAPAYARASAAGEHVYVMTNSGSFMPRVRPMSMHILSNENLGKMKWSSWGEATATARGTHYAGGPSPGHKAQNPVRVTLYGIELCEGDRLLYTKMKITFTKGKPYAAGPRTEKFPFGCPEDQ